MPARSHFAAPLLLVIVVALILYVSLYPFRFHAEAPAVLDTLRQLDWTGRRGLHDYTYICDGSGNLKQLVKRLPDEHTDEIRVWCLHGWASGDRVYVFNQNVRMLASGPMPVNFEVLGCGLAVGRRGEWDFRRIPAAGESARKPFTWPESLWWTSDLPQFGSTVLPVAAHGYV